MMLFVEKCAAIAAGICVSYADKYVASEVPDRIDTVIINTLPADRKTFFLSCHLPAVIFCLSMPTGCRADILYIFLL